MTKSGTSRTSKPCFKIQDLETLRVISDPLRTKIFEMLIDEPLTIRQLAERLGLATSRLYYQVNMMERAKFIRVTETRRVANLEEKVYQSVAPCIELAPGLLDFAKSGDMEISIRLLTGALDATREDLVRSLEARQMILEQGAEPPSPPGDHRPRDRRIKRRGTAGIQVAPRCPGKRVQKA